MSGEGQQNQNLNIAAACCAVALASLLPVAARQLDVIGHLPDPPGGIWASDAITGSKAARPLGIPDSLLGLGSFGITFGLLFACRKSDAARQLLAWKLVADGSAAGFNAVRQVVTFRRLCSWCSGTALATAGTVYFGARGLRRSGSVL